MQDNWLSLRDAAKKVNLARGWLVVMERRGVIDSFTNKAGQPEVCLDSVKAHKRAIAGFDIEEKLLLLLDDGWIKRREIIQALPSIKAPELNRILQEMLDAGFIEEAFYTRRGGKSKKYRVTNITSE